MKKLLGSILLALPLFMMCKIEHDPEPTPPSFWGETTVFKNGEEVTAKSYSTLIEPDSTVSVSVGIFDASQVQTGQLLFGNIPKRTGNVSLHKKIYPTDGSAYAIYFDSKGDLLYGIYDLLESEPSNSLIITSVDETSDEITGAFTVTMVVDSLDNIDNPSLIDTLRFTGGYFHTKIYRY